MVRIAFVGREGRTIVESADGEHMAFCEIAGAIAAVLAPDLPDEANENAKLVMAVERLNLLELHETSLKSLANTGDVPLIADCRLRLPVTLRVGEMLRRAFVPLRWVSDYCLELGVGVMPADRTPLDYSEQVQRKKEQGRYTLEEAAAAIADGSGERRDLLLNSLKQAVANGSLGVYEPGNRQRYQSSVVREFYEEAYWDDLNQWLEVHQKRIDWRFPGPMQIASHESANLSGEPKGVSKAAILAVDWPLSVSKNMELLKRALGDVKKLKWLQPATVGQPGKAGKTSYQWNPALLANCMMGQGWIVSKSRVTRLMEESFSDYLPQWEEIEEMSK